MTRAVLFDLDGTLLSIDTDEFLKRYMKNLSLFLHNQYKSVSFEQMIGALMKATDVVSKRCDGKRTISEIFWEEFCALTSISYEEYKPIVNQYYTGEFKSIGKDYKPNNKALECIKLLKDKGVRLILATNPYFPIEAVLTRLQWAGIESDSFELITHYENMFYTKSHEQYYKDILEMQNLDAQHCIMIGNDVKDDLKAANIGMDCYFLEEMPIYNGQVMESHNRGKFDDLIDYIERTY